MSSMTSPQPERIAVFGLGYVGSVSGACLAGIGHQVIGVDRDQNKVRSIEQGEAPFYEPGLATIVRGAVAAGRLTATSSARDAVAQSDIALVCVGTPSAHNGNISLDQLRRVVEEIAGALERAPKPYIVTIRSTVFPGTCEEVVRPALGAAANAGVVANPEFLREGAAVKDFYEPSLLVVGGDSEPAAARIAALYSSLPVKPCYVSLRTAELIKYACNCFHAVKIAFANEIGSLAQRVGVSPDEVMHTLCQDVSLNISPAYLKPGFAFGGSCLPKDLRALAFRASRLDLELPLLEATLPSNQRHLERATREVLALEPARLGVYGLSFKADTDDLRESPVIELLETLLGKGRDVRVYDPHIRINAIYGTNRQFLLDAIPHIGRLLDADLDQWLRWAEYLVLTQKPAPEQAARIAASGLPVLPLYTLGR
jgi:GDP-mannose 6-dehydrogenase